MAGYIEWSKGLAEKREVILIASRLKRCPEEIAGRLMRFWEWCDDNVPEEAIDPETGDAVIILSPNRGDTEIFIDLKTGLDGMSKALQADGVEWLRHERNGRVRLVHFGRHNGSTAKTRSRNARNQAKRRFREAAATVTDTSPINGDKKVTTQPNPTQPNKEEVGRSVGGSLEGVRGEGKPSTEFPSLLRIEDRHLNSTADLCAIHRAAHADHSEIVNGSEDSLLRVIAAANRAKTKATVSRCEFFRAMLRKRKLGTIGGQEMADARAELDRYRDALVARIKAGQEVQEKHWPMCWARPEDQSA